MRYDIPMLEKFLQEIGLSEKEATIYLHLLKMDSDSIANISKATGVNRTTVYPILNQLIKKQFVEEIVENSKSLYVARTPDRIESYLSELKIKIAEQTEKAKDMIPRLKGIMREGGQRPIIEYFEGKDEIAHAVEKYYEGLEDDSITYAISPFDKLREVFSKKERDLVYEMRIKKNIHQLIIYSDIEGKKYTSDNKTENFGVDYAEFPINSDISVCGDNIRIYNLGEKLGTIYIKSKDVSDTLKTLFRLAIQGLEKN